MPLCPVHSTVLWFDGECTPCTFGWPASGAPSAPTSTCCALPVVNDACSGCGIDHSEPCPACGQRGLHSDDCPALVSAEAVGF